MCVALITRRKLWLINKKRSERSPETCLKKCNHFTVLSEFFNSIQLILIYGTDFFLFFKSIRSSYYRKFPHLCGNGRILSTFKNHDLGKRSLYSLMCYGLDTPGSDTRQVTCLISPPKLADQLCCSCPVRNGVLPKHKGSRSVKLTTHFHVGYNSEYKMNKSVTLLFRSNFSAYTNSI